MGSEKKPFDAAAFAKELRPRAVDEFRYALEFHSSLADRSAYADLLSVMKNLQDLLGEHNDLAVQGRLTVAFPANYNVTLAEVLTHYVEHQKDVITRRTKYELAKARERAASSA